MNCKEFVMVRRAALRPAALSGFRMAAVSMPRLPSTLMAVTFWEALSSASEAVWACADGDRTAVTTIASAASRALLVPGGVPSHC